MQRRASCITHATPSSRTPGCAHKKTHLLRAAPISWLLLAQRWRAAAAAQPLGRAQARCMSCCQQAPHQRQSRRASARHAARAVCARLSARRAPSFSKHGHCCWCGNDDPGLRARDREGARARVRAAKTKKARRAGSKKLWSAQKKLARPAIIASDRCERLLQFHTLPPRRQPCDVCAVVVGRGRAPTSACDACKKLSCSNASARR